MAQTASYVCAANFECVTPLLANSEVNLLLVCAEDIVIALGGDRAGDPAYAFPFTSSHTIWRRFFLPSVIAVTTKLG